MQKKRLPFSSYRVNLGQINKRLMKLRTFFIVIAGTLLLVNCGGKRGEGIIGEIIHVNGELPEETESIDLFWTINIQPDASKLSMKTLEFSQDKSKMSFTPDAAGKYVFEMEIFQYGDELETQKFTYNVDSIEPLVTSETEDEALAEEEDKDWLEEEYKEEIEYDEDEDYDYAEESEDDEEEVKSGYKMENKKLKKEDLNLDVKEDMDAIMSGEELSEEFKTKAATIFEAAVSAKVISEVNDRVEALEEEFKKEIQEAKEEYKSNMSEKVDGYLNYVVEEWMKENELAVERGIRSELVEDFMTGLKNLFQEHYIDIPEEKVDLVDDLFEKVEDLEKQLDETVNNSVEMKKELAEYKKQDTLREVSEELADTEKEKLQKLSEGVDYEDSDQYKEKLEVIKENYFPKGEDTPQPLTEEVENNESEELVEEIDASVSFYAERLKRHNN